MSQSDVTQNAFYMYMYLSKIMPWIACRNESLKCSNSIPNHPDFLTTLKKEPFETILGKGENAGKPAFSPFPKMFSILP